MTDKSLFPGDVSDDFDGEDTYGADSLPYQRPLGQRRSPLRFERLAPRTQIGTRKTLSGLEWRAPYWVAEPESIFRMEGLLVMKAPDGSRLAELSVGNHRALPLGKPILLSTFTLIESLDSEASSCRARPSLPTCEPGVVIRLRVIGREGRDLDPSAFEGTIWGIVPHYL